MDYLQKYTPIKSKDIYCNYKQISDIKVFLNNFYDENKKKKIEDKILLILGPSGSCKTTICKCIFNECNYEPIKLDLFSYNNLKDNINQSIKHNTLDNFFLKKKRVLFLDDIDLISQYEKTFISFIVKLIKTINIPIICTANNIEEKKISEIKKKATKIYIRRIGYKECFQFLNNITKKENIDIKPEKLLDIVNDNNSDLRLILTNLEQYLFNYKETDKDNITKNVIEKKLEIRLSEKDLYINYGLFDFVKEILNKSLNDYQLNNIIHNDCSLISLLLHENILNEFNKIKNKASIKKNILESLIDILEIFTNSDNFEKFIFINNDWYFYEQISLLKILAVNTIINKFERINKDENLIFTQLLTKSSLRFNYKKKKRNLFNKISYNEDNGNTDFIFQILLDNIKNIDNNEGSFHKEDLDCITKYAEVFNLINKDKRKLLMNNKKNK